MSLRAVIFDLGGVVFPSPFDAFDAYERTAGLPQRFIRTVVAESADTGAWARLERSEVNFGQFCTEFEAECGAAGGTVDAAMLMQAITQDFAPRPEMLIAIDAIQANGLKVAALTNNWASGSKRANGERFSLPFDVVVESAIEGIRKPDPAIYALICKRLSVGPSECVFLDDLGVNLKPARAVGMVTIKVDEPIVALTELQSVLGFSIGVV